MRFVVFQDDVVGDDDYGDSVVVDDAGVVVDAGDDDDVDDDGVDVDASVVLAPAAVPYLCCCPC